MQYDLAAVLRNEGLTVVEEGDYARRGGDGAAYQGVMVHHTATGPKWTLAQLRKLLVTHGREGLPAPLCNVWQRRDGSVHVVAERKANHSGPGSRAVLRALVAGKPLPKPGKDDEHGNRHFIGIECENDGQGEGWSQQQMDSLVRVCAALCRAQGWEAHRVLGHREWTTRKVDPRGVAMDSLRTAVAHRLAGPGHAQATPTNKQVAARPTPSWEEAAVASLPVLGKGAGTTPGGNAMVKRCQALLVAAGQKVTVDGSYGPATVKSVQAFQKKAKLPVDGICGRGTWTKLLGL